MTEKTRIKICCIASKEEACIAVAHGAAAVGFVSHMPSGPGVIPESRIAEIVPTVPAGVATFLLTSLTDPAEIVAQQRRCGANTLQLCDALEPTAYAVLRESFPEVALVQVIHVVDEASVAEAERVAPLVDALLLDSGNPSLAVKELGGTGRTHDWSLSDRIVRAVSVPVHLAGGLNAGNVAAAIEAVRPWGVDVCSGVRTDDVLDEAKLDAFVRAVL